ncbi:glutamic protease [Lentinula aff. detonsa]|uniref:Glutamic protease n=1 Tax=Lentinula aff. detonsa TaxID=2804958 RepID=A0AA38KEW6_9AGAR|nr:glutamic protease [Lentinula aff. detonsa]KAJ3793590.1 glutamic protease [Lentinula aff. detonsa]
MKLTAFFISITLTFSVATASSSDFSAHLAARESRISRPFTKSTNATDNGPLDGSTTEDLYSTNWAGGLLESPPVGQRFIDVGGTFVVPTLRGNDGAMSVWIGIDGGPNAPQSILQTGIDCYIIGGVNYFFAWFEWYPQDGFEITNFVVAAQNTITLRVQAVNSTTGIITLTNESTGQSGSLEVTAPDVDAALQGQTAEWIVEDLEQDGALVPLPSFGQVQFTDAAAFTGVVEDFASVGVAVDMVQNGGFVATSTINQNIVTVDYA